MVEEQAQGMSVRDEDKAFIATVYKYAFVGLMLDWIKNDMKERPPAARRPASSSSSTATSVPRSGGCRIHKA